VLDSVGVGEMPDAAAYGDTGSGTLGNIARLRGLNLAVARLPASGSNSASQKIRMNQLQSEYSRSKIADEIRFAGVLRGTRDSQSD
jgi:phosphopentomutase